MEKDKGQDETQKIEQEKNNNYHKNIKRLKWATILVIGFITLALSVNLGVHATSTSTFCSSCHMMAPQALTWEASSHSSVDCKDCHIAPGLQNTVDAKISGLWELYHTVTDTYVAPIRMPSLIPDESCLTCHNMDNRVVSASGDIIIDHQIHDEKNVNCVTCHDGVAHGKVSERRIAYKSDYERWDILVAGRIMSDTKYTRPQMDKCMDCHELKNAPLTCETCHTTGMRPDDHNEKKFASETHGKIAVENLLYCESCHSYMSDNPIKDFQEEAHYQEFINADSVEKTLTVQEYAKTNTFCVTCHSERPDDHNEAIFYKDHGKFSEEKNDRCLTCHDFNNRDGSPVTKVTCASCHPSNHSNDRYKTKHPIPLGPEPKYQQSCLNCHVEAVCSSCHMAGNRVSNKEQE
ncbi:NapC/NirT family cytochrome c [Bacillaceae bacterium IKA-2]|nr:NapC/NirT family cytochrome c [Bacillaceae bacterium IKA-2]